MQLTWHDLRTLYSIPDDIALPPSPPPRIALILGASIILPVVILGAVPLFAGGSGNSAPHIVLFIVLAWIVCELILRGREVRGRDEPPPAEAREGDPIHPAQIHYLQIIASRIPGVLVASFAAWTRPPTLIAMLVLLLIVGAGLGQADMPELLCCWPFVLLFVPLIEAVRMFTALANIRKRLQTSACIPCGYDIATLATTRTWIRCPECGELTPIHTPLDNAPTHGGPAIR